MSYATPANVKSMFRVWTSGSKPAITDTELQEFLDDAYTIINAKVGTLYSDLPATVGANPEAYAILKRIEILKVADIVDGILNDYSEADKKPMWGEKAEALLKEIIPPINPRTCEQCVPTLILPDLTYTGTQKQKNSIHVSATSGRIFEKGGNNW